MYRDELHDDPCFVCQEPAAGQCDSCLRRACGKHLASPMRGWCVKCDDAYYTFRKQDSSAWVFAAWILGTSGLALGAVAYAPLFAAAVGWGVVVGPMLGWRERASRRRRFLTVMRTRGELPPPPERESDLVRAQTEYLQRRDQRIDEALGDKIEDEPGS